MKYATMFSSIFSLALLSPVAMSAPISMQAELIGAQGKLDSKRTAYSDPKARLLREGTDLSSQVVTAPGFGITANLKITDAARIGATTSWVNYDEGNTRPQYQDTTAGLQGSYDLYAQDNFAVFALAGASYHWLNMQDIKRNNQTTQFTNAELGNYDVGVGTRIGLSQNVNLDLAYRYSDTFAKDKVTADTSSGLIDVRGEISDLALMTNQVQASVGFVF